MKMMLGEARWVHATLPSGWVPVAVATSNATSTDHRPSQATGDDEGANAGAPVGNRGDASDAGQGGDAGGDGGADETNEERSPTAVARAARARATRGGRVSTSITELVPEPRAEVVWLHLGALH